jgi:hypothetical protein
MAIEGLFFFSAVSVLSAAPEHGTAVKKIANNKTKMIRMGFMA